MITKKTKIETNIESVSNIEENKNSDIKTKINFKLTLIVAFAAGVLLIFATYAWLSASLDVKVKFFNLSVSTDNGLFISLDGQNFSSSIEISMNSIISDINGVYPNHTNQWASNGLEPVSTIGIKNPNQEKFAMYEGEVSPFKYKQTNRKFITTKLMNEDSKNALNKFISFDVFFKNVSGSPKSDNLYFADGTQIDFADGTDDTVKEKMSGIINSIRFGIVKIGSVALKADIRNVQNITCGNSCQMVIYEPHSTSHSADSIAKVSEYGISMSDNTYVNTYAVTNEGSFLEYISGQEGTGIPLDTAHFALQRTTTDFQKSIFQLPNAITKARVYIWLEGQDMDSIESSSDGVDLFISLNFVKDLAGYE